MHAPRFHLATLNLNGIRSAASKGLEAWLDTQNLDCMCVQELKAQAGDICGRLDTLGGMRGYFHFAEKKGYSGVGIYCRHTPSSVQVGLGVAEFDAEGRYVELRFDAPGRKLSIISSYFPSGSSGQERQQAKYRFLDIMRPHLLHLARTRDFILCGDINIAHRQIDLKNWRGNQKNSGFLPEERAWLDDVLGPGTQGGVGLVDVYRRLHPEATDECYTWWSNRGRARTNNVGWRLDCHLATPRLAELAREAAIYRAEKFSDHAPLSIRYQFSL